MISVVYGEKNGHALVDGHLVIYDGRGNVILLEPDEVRMLWKFLGREKGQFTIPPH